MSKHPSIRGLLASSAALGAILVASPAIAQAPTQPQASAQPQAPTVTADHPPATAPEANGLTDIVVYARKRSVAESVQNVPLAITALGPQQLEASAAVNLQDVGRLAPNVQLTENGLAANFPAFTIRGLGKSSSSTRSVDPAVLTVVDGMVLGYEGNAVIDAFDLESIEILRGPQGTLFGKNSTGGVVSVRTRRPDGHFGIRGEVTLGNYNRRDFSASIQAPIVQDRLSAMITVLSRRRDGYYQDNNGGTFVPAPLNPSGVQPNNPAVDQSKLNHLIIRPVLAFTPSSAFNFTLLGEYSRVRDGGCACRAYIPTSPFAVPQILTTQFGYTPPTGRFETNQDAGGFSNLTDWHIIGEGNWNVGPGTITSVTALRRVPHYATVADADGSPFPLTDIRLDESSKQFSQELRFASSFSQIFDFTAGLYYLNLQMDVRERRFQGSAVIAHLSGEYTQNTRSEAAFATANVKLSDQISLSAGGRYTDENKVMDLIPIGSCTGGTTFTTFTGCPTLSTRLQKSFGNFSWRLGAQYQPNTEILAYASVTRGARSGNFNGRVTSVAAAGPADPETVDSYEIGLKTYWFHRHLRFNTSAFYMDYGNIQRVANVQLPGGGVGQFLTNAGAGWVKGIEVELTAVPVRGLELSFSGGLTDTHFTQLVGVDVNRDGVTNAADQAAALNLVFEQVPKYNFEATASYTTSVPRLPGQLTLRGSVTYRSLVFSDILNRPDLTQPAYYMLDASLTYREHNWRVSLFGRNLNRANNVFINSVGFNYQTYGAQPRTYGLSVSFEL